MNKPFVAWGSPVAFPEATHNFKAPVGWDAQKEGAECCDLPTQVSDGRVRSCWKFPFMERLAFLFHGKIWLEVVGGQPPVALAAAKTIFVHPQQPKD